MARSSTEPNEVLVFGWDEATGRWGERARLTPSEGWSSTGLLEFGTAIALSDRLALIAQPDSDGGVFVFERVGEQWVERQILERGPTQFVGTPQLALSGQTALIAYSDGVYVYEREGQELVEKQRLDLAEGEIGPSMALDGDLAIVGARHLPTGRGPVVFARDGESWVEEQELHASVGELQPDANYSGLTGCVALSGDTALVGGSHGAFLFVREDGQWQERLRIGCGEACGEEARQACPVALSGAVGVVSGHTTLRRLQGVWTAVAVGIGGDYFTGFSLAGEQLLVSGSTVYDLRQYFPSPTYDQP